MKNRKKILMAITILIAVVGLAIGYALGTVGVEITGTANAKTSSQFAVTFDGNNSNSTTDTVEGMGATASAENGATTGTCTVNLKTVNATGTCVFEIKNTSPAGINATINTTNLGIYSDSNYQTEFTDSTDSYFDAVVTPGTGWTGEKTLTPNGTTTFNVVVTLKKAWVGTSDHSVTFYVKLDGITASQA